MDGVARCGLLVEEGRDCVEGGREFGLLSSTGAVQGR